ncbi:thiamine biosynthetic bifunctional enzyme Thi4 [Crucibulum laeve]|uniref:Thiamine biosynthetic bifunctional enzyme Thi4 n=1 Tax=Crucibulum laeve TaxID=68775 RepID=A0A5C3MSA2_9AGAR|nr:thiamine biosynthetic bifunctional enzyme Thi4 [Crucibulum laeve]
MKREVDYSIYLVTGRSLLPHGKDYLESLEESLQGGVTVVQIREKEADTREFIQIARDSKALCDKYNVPLLVNDRVDVALAVKADGIHIGQDDMAVAQARKHLPEGSIIGLTCNTLEHVKAAIRDDVDYVGIGAVYGTKTKPLKSPLIGVRGVGVMLDALEGTNVKAVGIGGINSRNLLRTLHGTVSSRDRPLDGIAVVSDIFASPHPLQAAKKLSKIFHAFKDDILSAKPTPTLYDGDVLMSEKVLRAVVHLMESVRKVNPLIHQITNTVVATQSANVTLALGASPIMATEPQEMEDLSRICGALLVNIGTMRAENLEGMQKAGFYANTFRKPIVFDPVGIGASTFRKGIVKELLDTFQASVIKGNGGELAVLAGSNEVDSKGVDSVGSGFKDPIAFVKALSRKERSVVVLTGPTDYISDGKMVVSIRNGDEILGKITGSGCILGSAIAACCATAAAQVSEDAKTTEGRLVSGDMFLGAIAGVVILTVAAELAVHRDGVKGPGTFLSGLIDTLWSMDSQDVINLAKITVEQS